MTTNYLSKKTQKKLSWLALIPAVMLVGCSGNTVKPDTKPAGTTVAGGNTVFSEPSISVLPLPGAKPEPVPPIIIEKPTTVVVEKPTYIEVEKPVQVVTKPPVTQPPLITHVDPVQPPKTNVTYNNYEGTIYDHPPIQIRLPGNGASVPSKVATITQKEVRTIADRIFANESGSDVNRLVHWNVGEQFASMGIGHFTWYPRGRHQAFGNTFPGLLDYMQTQGVQLPQWLKQARFTGAPWNTRNELEQARRQGKVRDLQNLLYQTRYVQAQYILDRTKRAVPKLVNTTAPHLRQLVAQNLNAVANTPGGWYALIDYTNFKGEGLNRNGGYRGQNWGLLQVLENMQPSQPGQQALNSFSNSALAVLQRRINNSNPARNERRWLAGWTRRVNSYRQLSYS